MTEMRGQDVPDRLKILHILWVALGAAIIVYGVVAHVVNPLAGGGVNPMLPVLRVAFVGISVVVSEHFTEGRSDPLAPPASQRT